MSPWDEYAWFDTPIETKWTSISAPAGQQIVARNVRRVALIIAINVSTVSVSTQAGLAAAQGVSLSLTQPNLMLTQKDHGPLCQNAWFVSVIGGGAVFTTIESFLRDWPVVADKQAEASWLSRIIRSLRTTTMRSVALPDGAARILS